MVDAGIAACSTITAVTISPRLNGFKTNINIIGIMTILTAVNTNSHTFIYVLKINKCKRTAYKEHRQIRCCTADTGHYLPEYTAEFQSECHHHKCDNKRNRSGIYKIFILPINDFSFPLSTSSDTPSVQRQVSFASS